MPENKNTIPEIDIAAVSQMNDDERAAALADYSNRLDEYIENSVSAKSSGEIEKYKAEAEAAKEDATIARMEASTEFSDFAERKNEILSLIEENPMLKNLSAEEKYKTAYYIDRGKSRGDMSAEELAAAALKNSDAMRLIEIARAKNSEKQNGALPNFMAECGAANMPATPQKSPKNIEEASAYARRAFGI